MNTHAHAHKDLQHYFFFSSVKNNSASCCFVYLLSRRRKKFRFEVSLNLNGKKNRGICYESVDFRAVLTIFSSPFNRLSSNKRQCLCLWVLRVSWMFASLLRALRCALLLRLALNFIMYFLCLLFVFSIHFNFICLTQI